MAFFLRQVKRVKGIYLCVYETHRNKETKTVVSKFVKSFGNIGDLKSPDMPDPLEHFKNVVGKMNEDAKSKREKDKLQHIQNSPLRHLGYFPFFKILSKLKLKNVFDILQSTSSFQFNVFDTMANLIAARLVNPCSKHKTHNEVFSHLLNAPDVSYDQILQCIDFIGCNYEKVTEAFSRAVSENYSLCSDKTYFDCTNFYFEIDSEDNLRRKGPSKENRKDPIVGMGLLLDSNCIPIGMKIFPGNESEKPVLRKIIKSLKDTGNIVGKTVRVADKGLNCSENIMDAIASGDGYILSKSVKILPEKELVWLRSENDWKYRYDEEGNLLYKYKSCRDRFPYAFTDESGKKTKVELFEKRVLTFNQSLADKQKYEMGKMIEKAKRLCYSAAKKSEFGESGRYVNFIGDNEEKAKAVINEEQINSDIELAGYNMIVTSETQMTGKEIYETYHNLWRIEESFKVMKSELDARPVYLQKEERIKGHFLICYLSVLLLRLLQFKELGNNYGTSELIKFIKGFNVVKDEDRIINLLQYTPMISRLRLDLDEPITNLYLTNKDVKKMLGLK